MVALLLGFHFAYALSKKNFPNRKMWTALLIFTMFFSGGMVPDYLLIRDLDLINSIWSLILPGAISAYNITIMRNYLMSLPDSLEESAYIDGAMTSSFSTRSLFRCPYLFWQPLPCGPRSDIGMHGLTQ